MGAAELDLKKALRHLRRVDGPMDELIRIHGQPTFKRTRNAFASLGRAIISQQLSGKAANTIYGRFLDLFPRRRFPTPAQLLDIPTADLRRAGLSRAKASYLQDLARRFSDGTVQPRRFRGASNAEIADSLLLVKGIGQWSVDMFLMFGLCRPDVLPVGDLGVRKGVRTYFELEALPDSDEMHSLTEAWRPFRSVGSWYMWRVAEAGLPLD